LDLTKEQRQQIEDAKNEVSTQLKEYKKKCQLLSQIEVSEG
jgi:Spy/CpxP family protein refolding chaperone